mmetsp:Transcript_39686/g.81590  ORF Transcript_39686/g.81590 Transcript_39686/m.81590 type:complete len:235 (+) Transcript_39686:513-1217(+)
MKRDGVWLSVALPSAMETPPEPPICNLLSKGSVLTRGDEIVRLCSYQLPLSQSFCNKKGSLLIPRYIICTPNPSYMLQVGGLETIDGCVVVVACKGILAGDRVGENVTGDDEGLLVGASDATTGEELGRTVGISVLITGATVGLIEIGAFDGILVTGELDSASVVMLVSGECGGGLDAWTLRALPSTSTCKRSKTRERLVAVIFLRIFGSASDNTTARVKTLPKGRSLLQYSKC